MPILKTSDVFRKSRRGNTRRQIAVALCARLVPRRRQIQPPVMLHMAFRASKLLSLRCCLVMRWPVMTSQARRIRRRSRKSSRQLPMARRALLFEHCVCSTQSPAGINAIIMSKKVPTDPHQRNHRRQNRQPQFRALERSRPFEIIQVNPLRDRLGCPCPCHFWRCGGLPPLCLPNLSLSLRAPSIGVPAPVSRFFVQVSVRSVTLWQSPLLLSTFSHHLNAITACTAPSKINASESGMCSNSHPCSQ